MEVGTDRNTRGDIRPHVRHVQWEIVGEYRDEADRVLHMQGDREEEQEEQGHSGGFGCVSEVLQQVLQVCGGKVHVGDTVCV